MGILNRIEAGEFKCKLPFPKPLPQKRDDPARQEIEDAWAAYHAESCRLSENFIKALEEEHGMTGHPKASILYSKAYERGHSSGLYEIANAYFDLLELAK